MEHKTDEEFIVVKDIIDQGADLVGTVGDFLNSSAIQASLELNDLCKMKIVTGSEIKYKEIFCGLTSNLSEDELKFVKDINGLQQYDYDLTEINGNPLDISFWKAYSSGTHSIVEDTVLKIINTKTKEENIIHDIKTRLEEINREINEHPDRNTIELQWISTMSINLHGEIKTFVQVLNGKTRPISTDDSSISGYGFDSYFFVDTVEIDKQFKKHIVRPSEKKNWKSLHELKVTNEFNKDWFISNINPRGINAKDVGNLFETQNTTCTIDSCIQTISTSKTKEAYELNKTKWESLFEDITNFQIEYIDIPFVYNFAHRYNNFSVNELFNKEELIGFKYSLKNDLKTRFQESLNNQSSTQPTPVPLVLKEVAKEFDSESDSSILKQQLNINTVLYVVDMVNDNGTYYLRCIDKQTHIKLQEAKNLDTPTGKLSHNKFQSCIQSLNKACALNSLFNGKFQSVYTLDFIENEDVIEYFTIDKNTFEGVIANPSQNVDKYKNLDFDSKLRLLMGNYVCLPEYIKIEGTFSSQNGEKGTLEIDGEVRNEYK